SGNLQRSLFGTALLLRPFEVSNYPQGRIRMSADSRKNLFNFHKSLAEDCYIGKHIEGVYHPQQQK
ncbi:hypothetical protein, partial [Paenibacillus riograndensis]|uniref:hypothetical protein n=1 Tax=Paenibacillus riograndensis TaxID=483937 RepID=UPI000585235D